MRAGGRSSRLAAMLRFARSHRFDWWFLLVVFWAAAGCNARKSDSAGSAAARDAGVAVAPNVAPVIPVPPTLVPPPAAGLPVAPVPPLSSGAVLEDERNTIGVFRTAAKSTVFVTEKQVV